MFAKLIVGLSVLIKLSFQGPVWENLEDICYFNRSEVNRFDYVKTRCELVLGVQVQKRFWKDDYYWCIAIDNGQDYIIEHHDNSKNNIILPVAPEFLTNRSHIEHHIINNTLNNYTETYLTDDHKISVVFSPLNKLLSLKIDDIESCDQTRLNEHDPIYPNQGNKNPLKYFEKCVELNSIRRTVDHSFCEDLDIANFGYFQLNAQLQFNCLTINKSAAPDQYGDKMLDLVLYIAGNFTLRWSNTSNVLVAHSNNQFRFHVQDTIIISIEPKAGLSSYYIQNILVNNVTNCRRIGKSEICGSVVKEHRQFEFFEYPTYPGQYPWQVAIYKQSATNNQDKAHICDGTFIDDNVIVTAAHCLIENGTKLASNRISMVIGAYDLRVLSSYTKQLTDVASIILHPDFNEETRLNDIGLVLTSKLFDSNDYVSRVCFESEKHAVFDHLYGIVPSWLSAMESEYQSILSEARFIFDTNNSCECVYNSTELCGRYDFDETTPCVKDGGGLVVKYGDGYFLRGIATVRYSDDDQCQNGEQVIFADMLKYEKWIKTNYYRNVG